MCVVARALRNQVLLALPTPLHPTEAAKIAGVKTLYIATTVMTS